MRLSRCTADHPDLPLLPLPRTGEQVLVVAPHPDDETLGAAGLIRRARASGARVRVLFLTSGDGFPLCAGIRSGLPPTRARMRRFAQEREAEALQALQTLEVPEESVRFLRYPDRGLAALWLRCWHADNAYESPHTGARHVGAELLQELEACLAERPDRIYYPDAADDHPDHWAAHCFVRTALHRRLSEAGRPVERTYLIHRGLWPRPLRPAPDRPLLPPPELNGGGWETLPLSPEDRRLKQAAVEAHASQQLLMGHFLSAFLRSAELFREPRDGRVGEWLPDPIRDRPSRVLCGAGDFTGLRVDADRSCFRLQAGLRGPAHAALCYRLYWKPVDGPRRGAVRLFSTGLERSRLRGAPLRVSARALEAVLPRAEWAGCTKTWVAAEAWAGPVLLDRTAWQVLELPNTVLDISASCPLAG